MLGPNTPVISLNYPIFSDPAIYYGAQPPQFTGSASLKLRYDSNKGPVYVFQHQYSKLVIVQERDLLGGLQGSKRSFWRRWFYDDQGPAKVYERDDSQWTSGSTAVPGDRPWFCYWNGTMLEGLIFVKENGSAASLTAVSPSPAVSSESSLSPEGLSKRRASASLVSSPKPIKIEERWNSNSIGTPYCQQMQIHDTGRPVPVYKQGTDHVNIVNLAEQESPNQHQTYLLPSDNFPTGLPPSSTGFPVRRGFENSETTSVGCQCAWMMTR